MKLSTNLACDERDDTENTSASQFVYLTNASASPARDIKL